MTPGKQSTTIVLPEQKGIVSTMVASSNGILATGTYNNSIGLYDGEVGEQIALIDRAHSGGITGLKFIPNQENYLLSAARKCDNLKVVHNQYTILFTVSFFKCWDVRNMTKPVWTVERECNTNQKIQFDISSNGKMLLSGSTSGKLHFWELGSGSVVSELKVVDAHRSATNAASLHPFAPVCASGSGQRVFPSVADSDSEETMVSTPVSDNSLTLWTAFEY